MLQQSREDMSANRRLFLEIGSGPFIIAQDSFFIRGSDNQEEGYHDRLKDHLSSSWEWGLDFQHRRRCEKIGLHCPWPFQDGSLSGTLECRASQVG